MKSSTIRGVVLVAGGAVGCTLALFLQVACADKPKAPDRNPALAPPLDASAVAPEGGAAPEAGNPEGGDPEGGGREGGARRGLVVLINFVKTDTATSGALTVAPDGKVIVSATAGAANVTEFEPVAGVAKQTLIPDITASATARAADGSTMIVGRSGILPLAMRLGSNGQVAWAWTFGSGLDRAVSIAPRGATSYVVAYADKILELPTSGTGPTSLSFALPASTTTRHVVNLPSDRWAFAAEIQRTFPEQDALVVVMASNGTIAWQKLLANGGRTLVLSLSPLADGGLVMTGLTRPAGPTTAMNALVVRFAADGAVVWQRIYGTGGNTRLESAIEVPNGIRLGGTITGALAIVDVALADGAVLSAMRYDLATSLPLGIAQTPSGEVVLAGITTTTHSYQFVKTAPDLGVDCTQGAPFAATVEVSSTPGTLNVISSTFTPTSSPVTTTPVTVTPGAAEPVPVVERCGG